MTEAITKMYEAWRPAVSLFQVRSGQLSRFATSGVAQKTIGDGSYELRFFLHLRFLDIQYRNNRSRGRKAQGKTNLYNKLVWSLIFKHIFPELRYGFTDEVRNSLHNQLSHAIESK